MRGGRAGDGQPASPAAASVPAALRGRGRKKEPAAITKHCPTIEALLRTLYIVALMSNLSNLSVVFPIGQFMCQYMTRQLRLCGKGDARSRGAVRGHALTCLGVCQLQSKLLPSD